MIVRFTASASQEVFDITRHYAALNRDLGRRFIDRIDEVLASLLANPGMGMPVSSEFRRMLLRQFPYAVYYRIDTASASIWIESVVHQRRRTEHGQNGIREEPAIYATAA